MSLAVLKNNDFTVNKVIEHFSAFPTPEKILSVQMDCAGHADYTTQTSNDFSRIRWYGGYREEQSQVLSFLMIKIVR